MPTNDTSDPWLRKITALLAKAESTEYPDEAEALLAKAQQLMVRHAIGEALLTAPTDARPTEIVTRSVVVEPPYARARVALLNVIGGANDCCMVFDRAMYGRCVCHLVGHASDLDNVALLFAALSLQATSAMLRAHPNHDGVRAFRRSFLLGFSRRIGERLGEARATATAEATTTSGLAVAVALQARSDAVERAFRAQFPRLRADRTNVSSWSGATSGRAAADRTALGGSALQATRALGTAR